MEDRDVYIRRGAYVESFTLPASVTLIGLTAGTDVPFVEIQGTIVINAAGNYAMKDLTINPAAGPALTVTSATLLELDNVVIDPTAGIGAQFQSAAAATLAQQCTFNSAAADAIQVTNGALTLEQCIITNEVDVSGTATVNMSNSSVTGITLLTGTPTLTSTYTSHDGGASEAFNLGIGTTLNLFHGNVTSTNAGGWVIGTGTINYAAVVLDGSATNLAGGLTITNPDWKPYGDCKSISNDCDSDSIHKDESIHLSCSTIGERNSSCCSSLDIDVRSTWRNSSSNISCQSIDRACC